MRKNDRKDLERARRELATLAAQPDARIDTSDMPEVRDWSRGERGKFYRPVKQQLTLRLDADLVDWFRRNPGPDRGYQTRINRALREYVEREAGD